ncbi:MAG: diaminopimelate epimerase [Beijerinckiaceae bacterium]|nr:diaminopimelate epimerase [Beijerinckiaceae bacterium]
MSKCPLGNKVISKLNGLGNKIAVLDLRGTGLTVSGAEARAIGRGGGLAFDQLMVLHEPRLEGAGAFLEIYNRDGSRAESCGNGTRCVAFILTRGTARERLVLETAAARLECSRVSEMVFSVDMGEPRLAWHEIPLSDPFQDTRGIELQIGPIDAPILHTPSAVNMGNPHAIFWVEDIEAYDLSKIGPLLENHPIFPERANISLAHVMSKEHIGLRVWERGTGLTRACGSAACAALVAASRKGLTGRRAAVSLPGGDLDILWRESDDHVLMTGPVEFEFETRLDPALFSDIAA